MKKQILFAGLTLCLAGTIFTGQYNTQAKAKKMTASKKKRENAIKYKKQYKYVTKGNTVTINKYIGKAKKVTIPKKINGKKVTKIGNNAFKKSKVTSVEIPASVKTIEGFAFAESRKLKQVKLPDSVTTLPLLCFWKCEKLEKINIPKKLKKTEAGVFQECVSLKKISLPKGVTSIGSGTFKDCASLTSVKMNSRIKKIGGEAFEMCENLLSVGDITVDKAEAYAFYGCRNLTSKITLSDKCGSVERYAFYGCEQADITIPESVKFIGTLAFADCKKLTSITIPDGFTGIGNTAADIGGTIPFCEDPESEYKKFVTDRVGKNFDMNAFAGCCNVASLTVKDKSGALIEENGVIYNRDKTMVLYVVPSYSGTLDFLKKVDTIGPYAMSGFNQPSIVVPDNVTHIMNGAFYGAKSTQITLGRGVKKLYDQTFAYSGVTSLTIPEGVEEIIDRAISYCRDCKSVSFPKSLKNMNYDDEFGSPLRGMSGLEKVEVAEENPIFYSKDGMLFKTSFGETSLLCYPAAKQGETYTPPADIRLGNLTFDSLKYLKKLIIPEGMAENNISNLMADCKGVTVQLPDSFTNFFPRNDGTIECPMFWNCENCTVLVHKNSAAHKYCKKYCTKVKKQGGDASLYAYKVV